MKRKYLAVEISLLFITTCIIPVIAQDIEKPTLPTSKGNWLYVGGSGPSNYTRIQDAINDSHDEDTVFVYSGLYTEAIVIPTAIRLIGESKNTTIIEGLTSEYETQISIQSNNITISGFTIFSERNYSTLISNNYLPIQNVTVSDNIFKGTISILIEFYECDFCTITQNTFDTYYSSNINLDWTSYCTFSDNQIKSVERSGSSIILYHASYSRISNNTINSQRDGLRIIQSSYNTISNNYFFNNSRAIYMEGFTLNNSIISNVIDNPPGTSFENIQKVIGIHLTDGNRDTRIEKNIISNYRCGIIIEDSYFSKISMNTFMNNKVHARFNNEDSSQTIWDQNYWGRPRILPKLIFGIENFYQVFPDFIQFDWHPAQEPYDFPGIT